jgi:acetyl-CoA carboxylase carboxyltransferase component
MKTHVSAQQQQINARQHQNANNEATNCARESNKTSTSLQHGTYRLRDSPFDTTSNVRSASAATADAIVATATTANGPRVCVHAYENTRVSKTTTNQRATSSKRKQ